MQSDDPPAVGTGPNAPPPLSTSALLRARSPNPDAVNRNDSNNYITTTTTNMSALSTSSSVLMSAGLDATGPPVSPTSGSSSVTSSSLLNKLYQTQSVTAAARPRSQTMVNNRGRPPTMPLPPPPSGPAPTSDGASAGPTALGGRAKSKSSSQLPFAQDPVADQTRSSGILSPLSPALAAPLAQADPQEVQRHHTETTRRSKEGLTVDTVGNRSLNGEVKKSASATKLAVKKSSSLVNVVNAHDTSSTRARENVHEGVTRTWYMYLVVPLILGLWSGLAVILTGTLAIVTNLGNLIFSIHATASLWIPASFSILFYLYLILCTSLSLIRTALRLMTWLWTLPSRFGPPPTHAPSSFPHVYLLLTSPHKAIPQAVDVAVEGLTEWIWARVHPVTPRARGVARRSLEEAGKTESAASMYSSAGDMDEDEDDQKALVASHEASDPLVGPKKKRAKHGRGCQRSHVRIVIQVVLLLAVAYYKVGIPILFAVSHWGLRSTCAMLAASVSLGAAALILVVNLGKGLFRFAAVARQLWSEPDDEKRLAMAGASLGLGCGDMGEALDQLVQWKLATVGAVAVVGLTFFRYPESPVHFFVLCSILVLLTSFRLRSLVCRRKPASTTSPSVTTKASESSLRAMFFLRSAAILVALTCSTIHDLLAPEMSVRLGQIQLEKLTPFTGHQVDPANVAVSAFLFAVGCIGQDSVFAFTKVFTARMSALLLLAFTVVRVVVFVRALATPDATCLTFLTMGGLLITSWNIGNQARSRGAWDRKSTRNQGSLQSRVLFHSGIVLTVSGVWLVSMLGLSNQLIAGRYNFPYQDPRWPVLPREMTLAKDVMCNFKVQDLKLLELVSLATAPMAGDGSSGAIMNWVNQNPTLRGSAHLAGEIHLADGTDQKAGGPVVANPLGLQPVVGNTGEDQAPFVEFRLTAAPQTSIIAIRGPRSFGHAILHSRILWSTAWFFSASSPFGTLFEWWSDEVATSVVSTVHQVLSIGYMPETSGIEVLARMLQDQGRNLVLVGHGYAGALAHVVGARLGVPTFATSAPGLETYRMMFRLMGSGGFARWTSTLVPDRDAVSALGKQAGTNLALAGGCYGEEWRCHDPKALVAFLLDRCYWEEHYRNESGGGFVARQGQVQNTQAPPIHTEQPLPDQHNKSATASVVGLPA